MTDRVRSSDATAVDRRSLLAALAAAGTLGAAGAGAAGATDDGSDAAGDSEDQRERRFVVEQGDERYAVTPLSGDESVEAFYDLRIPEKYTGDNGATDPGEGPYWASVGTRDLQRPSTSLLFFYEGPDGVSLVVVHDEIDDDGGGAVTWTVSGVPEGAEWLVKDDYYLFESGERPESNYDNWDVDGSTHEIDWTWAPSRGDGGALGYLDPGAELRIDPAFNEAAELYGEHFDGDIDDWQLLSADGDGVGRFELDLDEPLTVSVEGSSGSDSSGSVLPFDLSVAPPDGKVNVNGNGLVHVEVDCPDPSSIDVDSVEFGAPDAVDDGDAAAARHEQGHGRDDGKCELHFDVDETRLDPSNELAKLIGTTNGDGESDGDDFSLTDAVDVFDSTDDNDRNDDGEDEEDDGDEEDDERGESGENNGRGRGTEKDDGNSETAEEDEGEKKEKKTSGKGNGKTKEKKKKGGKGRGEKKGGKGNGKKKGGKGNGKKKGGKGRGEKKGGKKGGKGAKGR
ncbi:MAG: hypothetical protein ABEJ26_09485 [Halosimplex sp.]